MLPPIVAEEVQRKYNEDYIKNKELQRIYRKKQEDQLRIITILFTVAITVIILVIF